jgi:hypothetical protein
MPLRRPRRSPSTFTFVTFVVATALAAAHCSSSGEDASRTTQGAVRCDAGRGAQVARGEFTRFTVDGEALAPAYVAVADMNGDGKRDLVVSKIGPVQIDGPGSITLSRGEVSIYLQGDSLSCWQKVEVVTAEDNVHFPGLTTLADVDGDGDLDVMLPAGFFVCRFDKNVKECGAIAWFENTLGSKLGAAAGTEGRFVRHDIVPKGDPYFYHQLEFVDFDGDGIKDMVTSGEQTTGAKTVWFKGTTTADRFETTPRLIAEGGGSFPRVFDIDGDGDLDVVSAEFFVKDSSFAWFERKANPSAENPAGVWERHVFDKDSGKGFMVDVVPNLFGDGKLRVVATNHTNTHPSGDNPDTIESSVYVFEIPSDPRASWPKTTISSGIASRPDEGARVRDAPGVFGFGDIDGDGDIDLAVAGDGDARTFWMEQTAPGTFRMHVLEESLGQASGALVTDVSGDGKNELVFTGYEDGAVFVYARNR